MWIEFNQLPEDSRVWIFPIIHEIELHQVQILKNKIQSFIEDWTSHNQALKGSGTVLYGRFAVISLDQSQVGASGCSIDKLMRFIQMMEGELGIPLLLKTKIGIQKEETILFYTFSEIKAAITSGALVPEDKYFDLMITEKSGLHQVWMKPLMEGWLSKKLFN